MNPQPNILLKFWYFLTFKTHHNNLLTTGGASYLTVISVIVSLAALSEAFAWGHFGSTFTPETPMLGGLGLGIFIFLLFWFFDRTMATQDMLTNEHALTLEGEDRPNNAWYRFKIGTWIIFVARLGIVIGSLYITAPFLTQLVFSSDIKKEMEQEYKQSIETAKEKYIGNLNKKIDEQQNYVKSLHEKLQQEIGGKRGTGYDKGEVAKSIELEINAVNTEIDYLKKQSKETENKINQAIKNKDFYSLQQFNIFAVKDSPIFREQAVEKLKKQPAFNNTKHAVEGFLIIVGLILILAKLLQPKSLQMYYSSRLQEAWINYRNGNYDDYLANSEKSINMANSPMPQTFEKIAIRYAKTKEKREKDAVVTIEKEQKAKIKAELEAEQLKESEQQYVNRRAAEVQKQIYYTQNFEHLKKQINESKHTIQQQIDKFWQENKEKFDNLKQKQKEIIKEIEEASRIYQSQKEDALARQKRIQREQENLAELINIASDLEQPDKVGIENTKSYNKTQKIFLNKRKKLKI